MTCNPQALHGSMSPGCATASRPKTSSVPNTIIVFGETGAGKSSVINMLSLPSGIVTKSPTLADVSGNAKSHSEINTRYRRQIFDKEVDVFKAVGLGQASGGTIPHQQAIAEVYQLVRQLESGIHLLIYVVQGPRITSATRRNYEMFYNIFCRQSVPIVVVITHMEDENDPEAWWAANREAFDKEQMFFDAHACITASEGKGNRLSAEYGRSRVSLCELVALYSSGHPWIPGDRVSWLEDVSVRLVNWLSSVTHLKARTIVLEDDILNALLVADPQMDKTEAKKMANRIYRKVHNELKSTAGQVSLNIRLYKSLT